MGGKALAHDVRKLGIGQAAGVDQLVSALSKPR